MGARVISISFSDGSGGEAVAVAAAAALGFPVVSEEILSRAAAEAGVSVAAVADVERRKTFMTKLVGRLVPSATDTDGGSRQSLEAQATASLVGVALPLEHESRPSQDELRGKIRSAIDEYMATGDVVILGHAASHSLSGRAGVLRVFVTGSPAARSARLVASRQLSPRQADKLVETGDANRADYLKRFYGITAESPSQYDVVLDTDQLAVAEAARIIVSAAAAIGAAPAPSSATPAASATGPDASAAAPDVASATPAAS